MPVQNENVNQSLEMIRSKNTAVEELMNDLAQVTPENDVARSGVVSVDDEDDNDFMNPEKMEDKVNAMNAAISANYSSNPENFKRFFKKPKPYVKDIPNIRRNDLCHCGSGKKYKDCCWKSDHSK